MMKELEIDDISVADGDVITLWIEACVGEELQISHKAYTYECHGESYWEKHTPEIIIK